MVMAAVALAIGAALFHGYPLHRAARAEDGGVGRYLLRESGETADPVNIIFAGEADGIDVAARVSQVLRWTPVQGSRMAFTSGTSTVWTQAQLGAAMSGGARRHLRLAAAPMPSAEWGPITLAAVHRDQPVTCGHAGRAFDQQRDEIAVAMQRAGFAVSWTWLGNDGPVRHCDGSVTHGDGWVAVIDLTSGPASTSGGSSGLQR